VDSIRDEILSIFVSWLLKRLGGINLNLLFAAPDGFQVGNGRCHFILIFDKYRKLLLRLLITLSKNNLIN